MPDHPRPQGPIEKVESERKLKLKLKYIPTNTMCKIDYNLASDARLIRGSQDFLCFPDQKNEKSACFRADYKSG